MNKFLLLFHKPTQRNPKKGRERGYLSSSSSHVVASSSQINQKINNEK
jgi:hypothetical protein